MSLALFSGLSGLRANQQYLDVIGNNLANSNTPGYKASRVTFGDVLSQSLRRASAPTATLGGVNPTQLGRGVSVASIDQNFGQGRLVATGRNLDLAIQGDGFFVASNGSTNFFTRVGALNRDADEFLVDARTGYRIRADDGSSIQLPQSGVLEPNATTQIDVRGNLPGKFTGPTIDESTSVGPYLEAYPAQITGSAGPFNLTGQNTMTITVNGTTRSVTFDASNLPSGANVAALTASDIVTALNAVQTGLNGAVASVSGGAVQITTTASGQTQTIAVSGPAATALGIASTSTGTETEATATTALNDLKINTADYVAGDVIRVRGSKPDGTTIDADFVYGTDGTTLGDLQTFADALFAPDATVTLDSAGVMHLTAANPGAGSFSLSFADDTVTGGGASDFGDVEFQNDVAGVGPDTETTTFSVFDSLGVEHTISLKFERQITGEWTAAVEFPDGDGTLTSVTLPNLNYGTDGKLSGTVARAIEVQWAGSGTATQTISINLQDPTSGEQLTQLGASGLVSATQDGYTSGSLLSFTVEPDGTVRGDYSNGLSREIARLQVALFTNPAGLERAGNGFFVATSNSGQPQFATAGSGGAGAIVSGSLEGSNVDVAEEFVRLIEAQRGFQANARIISTSNEVLAELTRLGQ
jgi:flagellar hook protein FlgE